MAVLRVTTELIDRIHRSLGVDIDDTARISVPPG
jgi:hypothetical protein